MNTPSHPVRDNLVGYLLNAVEAEERAEIELHLKNDPNLREELEVLRRGLQPLAHDIGHHAAPAGLARRCCEFVRSRTEIMPAALSRASAVSGGVQERRRWSWIDFTLAGAIALAVAILLVPAIYQSHVQSQLLACQKNLQDIGGILANFSDRNGSYYPTNELYPVKEQGQRVNDQRLNVIGISIPILISQHYLQQGRIVVCPASDFADDMGFVIPSVAELHAMTDAELKQMLPKVCGSYGDTLGYRVDGAYKHQRNRHRTYFAIFSDVPNEEGTGSRNHGMIGHNVLFDDGHVCFMTTVYIGNSDMNIFRNAEGLVGPGSHENDAVIVRGQVPVPAK